MNIKKDFFFIVFNQTTAERKCDKRDICKATINKHDFNVFEKLWKKHLNLDFSRYYQSNNI